MTYEFESGTEFQVKRFYLPKLQNEPCPICKTSCEHHGDQDYISYPEQGGKEDIPYYCEVCEDHFDVEKVFKLSITLKDGE